MSNYTYRPGLGLAFSKAKDIKLFKQMALKGYRPVHLSSLTGFYKFQKCDPEEVVYAADCANVDPGSPEFQSYREVFEGGGWEFVYGKGGCNFFKAPKGTTPIYTDRQSESAMHRNIAKKLLPWLLVSVAAFVVSLLYVNIVGKTPISFLFWALALASAYETVILSLGISMSYYRSWKTLKP